MTIAGEKVPLPQSRWARGRLAVAVLVAAGVAGLFAINAHFVYVSVMSQPECVEHAKEPGSGASGTVYRAAKSSC
jgi:hypothetical protein